VAVIQSEFDYGPVTPDGQLLAITGVRKLEAYRNLDGFQITVTEMDLRDHDLERLPRPVDVHGKDNLYMLPEGQSSGDFLGQAWNVGVPEELRRLIRVREEPRPLWDRE